MDHLGTMGAGTHMSARYSLIITSPLTERYKNEGMSQTKGLEHCFWERKMRE